MKLIVTVALALGGIGSVWAVRAPQPEMASPVRQDLRVGGLRRPTTDFSHLRSALLAKSARRTPSKILKTASSVPTCWDSREHGWVTSIKNQGGYGTCWAFATMASLETAFLKASDGAVANDFSENHMATHDVGFGFGFDGGGNNQVAAALLTSWRDPLLESEDPYPNPGSTVSVLPQCHVQDIVWLPERFCPGFNTESDYAVDAREDNREVDAAYKRAIMTYGAVSVGYYHAWNHYNSQTAAHCFQYDSYSGTANDGGHAVTLVGWDDDYPAENFVSARRPKGNGAFLVKNSWGPSSGTTNGCTWISYYDESINYMPGAAYPCPGARDNYGRIYEYDPCGQVQSWNVCDTDAEQAMGNVTNWCANVFTATASGVIEAVGIYAMSADTAYTLRVYRNCASSPSDGELMVEQKGTVVDSGFATVSLATPVPVNAAGTKFSVVLQLTCPGYDYPLPVECTHYESDEDGNPVLWCACTANAGESFMSRNGRDWRDFQDYDPTGNFCIKAYTRFGSDGEVSKLIVSSSPEADSVSARVGDSRAFEVTAEAASAGEAPSYVWRVNGVPADCAAAEFVFTPTFAQRGNCAVECLVQSGVSVDVRKWTLVVNADLHVRADSTAADPDGSIERPFAAISDACIAAIEGDTVLVGPGVYYGTLEGPSVRIEIRSANGPDETVLDAEGVGRCFLAVQNDSVVLSGFTLRNAAMVGYRGGGAYGGVITNCVISNCVATVGGGAYGAELRDCRITGCVADYYGGGLCDSTAEGCVVFGNVAYEFGGGAGGYDSGCMLSHCTVFGNQSYSGGGVDYTCLCEDSIVWGNFDSSGNESNWDQVRGWGYAYATEFVSSCTYPVGFADGGGNTTDDPQFVSLEAGDWRLRVGSPCIGAAHDGGNMGAWQGPGLVGHVISTVIVGRGEVSPVSAFVLDGESVTFVANGDHPFLRIETNGVWATDAPTFCWTDVHGDGVLTACFGATNYYVDASAGRDENDGLTPASPRKSLQSTVDRTWSGDVVCVKPGVYDGLEVLWPGVKVVSADGAARTVISTNAYRECFYTPYADVSLVGFTLRDAYLIGQDGCGGGAYGGSLTDCVISNCTASFGGGAMGVVLTNCLVVGNRAESYRSYRQIEGGLGGGVCNCQLWNCTISGNSAASFGGGAYLDEAFVARNTIVAANTCDQGFDNGNDIYGMGYYETVCSVSDVDARFVDSAHGDWRLSANSPCIDAGSNALVSVAHDLDGSNRIFGPRVDMGCYEYSHRAADWPVPAVEPGDSSETEAARVGRAMADAGFSESTAAKVTTLAQYNALSGWAEGRNVGLPEMAGSPTALVSAALWADGLLDLDETDLKVGGFSPAGNGWRFRLDLEDYDPNRVNAALLKAAVGVVGSETPTGVFSSEGLGVSVSPGAEYVEVSVVPPSGKGTFFLKGTVR